MNATPAPNQSSRIKKAIAGGLIAVTAVGGAAAFVPTFASAQDAETQVETPAPDAEEREGRRGHRHGNRAAKAEAIAEVLGLSVEDLRTARQEGQTLAEIAGADVDALIAAMVDAKTERIEAAVESGRLTQQEADEKLAGLEEKVTEKVNAEPGERGPRGERGERGIRFGGQRGTVEVPAIADA